LKAYTKAGARAPTELRSGKPEIDNERCRVLFPLEHALP